MTTPHTSFEALMPEPDIRIDAFGDIHPTDRRTFVMGDFYTADQMREAIRAATEAAAKKCDQERDEFLEASARNNGRESDFAFGSVNSAERLAAAIRGGSA